MLLTCLGVYLSVWTQKKSWEAQRDSLCVCVPTRTAEQLKGLGEKNVLINCWQQIQ